MFEAKPVVKKLPGEFLHRAASFTIISEGLFHTFNKSLLVVVFTGIIFAVVEVTAIVMEVREERG